MIVEPRYLILEYSADYSLQPDKRLFQTLEIWKTKIKSVWLRKLVAILTFSDV